MTTTQAETMTFAEAIRAGLTEAMEADERVFVLGEDIGVYGGAFGVTTGMLDRFGEERIRDTPIAEEAIMGAAVGAALCGMRPVAEMQFSDFTAHAMDQLVNQAAKVYFMLGGAISVPLVLRLPFGSGTGAAAQHSQSQEAWYAHTPGLKVVMPSNPAEACSTRPSPTPTRSCSWSTRCCTGRPRARCRPPPTRSPSAWRPCPGRAGT
jgi:pyruvate/2-oxoglutarate/acetoin dehydrogenase E1 component